MAGDTTTTTSAVAGPDAGTGPHSAAGIAGDRPVTTILRPEDY